MQAGRIVEPRSQKLQLPCPLTPVRAWGTNCTAGLASSSAPPRQGLGSRHACPECLSQPICSPAVFLWVWGRAVLQRGAPISQFALHVWLFPFACTGGFLPVSDASNKMPPRLPHSHVPLAVWAGDTQTCSSHATLGVSIESKCTPAGRREL